MTNESLAVNGQYNECIVFKETLEGIKFELFDLKFVEGGYIYQLPKSAFANEEDRKNLNKNAITFQAQSTDLWISIDPRDFLPIEQLW